MSRFFLSFILLSMVACKTDTVPKRLDIHGKWNIYQALRNGTETKTLERGYLYIDTSKMMISSNIFPEGNEIPYTLEDKHLIIMTTPSLDFTITEKNLDSMSLKGALGPFMLELFTLRGDSLFMDGDIPTGEVVQ